MEELKEDILQKTVDKIKTINLVSNPHYLMPPIKEDYINQAKINNYIKNKTNITFRLKNHQEYFIKGIIKSQIRSISKCNSENMQPIIQGDILIDSFYNNKYNNKDDDEYLIEVELDNKESIFFKESEIDFETITPSSYNPIRYFERGIITPELKEQVFKRANNLCQLKLQGCTTQAECCDHIIPVIKGGLTILDNLQASCNYCNLKKGSNMLF